MIYLGLFLALLTAFTTSLLDVLSKRTLKTVNEYVVAFSVRFYTLFFLLPFFFFLEIPALNNTFWFALLINGLLNLVTSILYLKALKASDLSLSVPLVTFTPFFLLITSPLLVGEIPTALGMVGVFCIVMGSYVLNLRQKKAHPLAPFRALLKERGPRLMLCVAFLWSISSNFDKIGVQNSSPIFWSFMVNLFIVLLLFPYLILKTREEFQVFSIEWKKLLPFGALNASAAFFQMTAVSLTLVTYVISVKRLSVVFSVFWGYLLFKEEGIKERLLGSLVMVGGVVLIAFS
ncbi:EamA family transporter [Candidatus Woesearchaeota archaeon]|nr:EamA family transporter [Candidatus Woesearchaeota archaeon]